MKHFYLHVIFALLLGYAFHPADGEARQLTMLVALVVAVLFEVCLQREKK